MLERLNLKGKKTIIRDLKREDVDKRLKWKPYPDPLYYHYNLPYMRHTEKELWYMKKKENPSMVYLSIDNLEHELIGFLSLFKIDRKNKSSEVGIYLGYEFINQGYGTDALLTLMKYYFEKLGWDKLLLDVAALNKRAIRSYEKCGFRQVRTKFKVNDPRTKIDVFSNDRFKNVRKYFRKRGKDVLVQFDEMVMSKEMWSNRNEAPNR